MGIASTAIRATRSALARCLAYVVLAASTPLAAAADDPHWLAAVISDEDRRHLLARTGIGVSPLDYAALDGLTRAQAIEHVIEGLAREPTLPMPDWTRGPPPPRHARGSWSQQDRQRFDRARDAEIAGLRQWWNAEMLATDSPQTERLVLLWHDLVPTSYAATDRASLAIARQNALFRRAHSGNWATMMKALLQDAALLEYLDADRNRRNAPNENLAREFLELFTLGEGHFSETDVREAARALTGLAHSPVHDLAFRLHTWTQDRDDKTVFGRTDRFDADSLVDVTLAQPAAADHLATAYWHAYISDAPPMADELAPISSAFRASALELSVLYRQTLRSEAFWAPRHRAGLVKSPVDLLTGAARTLQYPQLRAAQLPGWQGTLGMALFAPPNVAGWQEGGAFVTPGRLVGRYAAVERLLAPDARQRPEGADAPMMAGDMQPTMAAMDPDALTLHIASDAYQGAARILVSLRAGERTIWNSGELALRGGHDTERFGSAMERSALPWQALTLDAPAAEVARADAVRVLFLNDAAGPSGDRNVYLDRVRLGNQVLEAASGVQVSECVPEQAVDAGDLYCAGHVTIERPPAPAAVADTPVSASAVHLVWARSNPAGRDAVTLALDDLQVDDSHREVMQLQLVARPGDVPELRFDSFDCREECLEPWPDCAWQDANFPPARALSVSLLASERLADACLQGLTPADRALVDTVAQHVPYLLAHVAQQGSPGLDKHRVGFDALRARVLEHTAGEVTRSAATFDIDARRARPWVTASSTVALGPPPVTSLGELQVALAPSGIDAVSLLWPGLALPEGLQPGDAPVEQRLTALTRHPGFQLR